MANAITALSPTYWSKIMGVKLYKKNIYRSICSFREEAVLTDGQIVDRPYRADIYVGKYTKGTALTAQDITATTDKLTVDQIFAALIYVDKLSNIVHNKFLKLLGTPARYASYNGMPNYGIDAQCLKIA